MEQGRLRIAQAPAHDFAGRIANKIVQTAPALRESVVQAIDAILGLQRRSQTGQLILEGRAYLLPQHRRFLGVLEHDLHRERFRHR